MPSLLLDRHIDEAAMRRDEPPTHFRRGRGQRVAQRTTVATVARAAVAPTPRRIAPVSHLTGRDEREIHFDDLPPENPNLLTSDPRHAAPVEQMRTLQAPALRPGHEHADTVLAGPRAETTDEHTVHHQVPLEWLATVPLLSALDTDRAIAVVDEAAAEHETALVSLACAIADLSRVADEKWRPIGRDALAEMAGDILAALDIMAYPLGLELMMLDWNAAEAERAAEAARVGDVDRRPAVPHVGYDLTAVA